MSNDVGIIQIETDIVRNELTDELYQAFAKYIDAKPKTVETYTKALRQLGGYFAEHHIDKPTREDVIAFREDLKRRDTSRRRFRTTSRRRACSSHGWNRRVSIRTLRRTSRGRSWTENTRKTISPRGRSRQCLQILTERPCKASAIMLCWC